MAVGQRILVSGGTGFTGGQLCARLAKEGHSVRALVRDPGRCHELRQWGVQLAVGDLRDPGSVERATQGVNVVYHIGALYRQANASRKDMWEINVQGTRNMLNAALKHDVQRFVHCSTVGVHGDVQTPPATEEAPYAPGDDYQVSKLEGERVVLQSMVEGRLPIVVFRPGGIYGPHDLRFLKLLKAIKTRRFVMLGSGQVIYQMIYIDDLIDGIRLCGTQAQALGNIYILNGEEAVSLNQLVGIIAEVLAVPPPQWHLPFTPVYLLSALCEWSCKPFRINPPLFRRRVDFFRKTRWFDISKAKRELGFQPKIDLKTGIKLTADWYHRNGML